MLALASDRLLRNIAQAIITFIDARHGKANSSQREASFGLACRFTFTMTCLPSAISNLDLN